MLILNLNYLNIRIENTSIVVYDYNLFLNKHEINAFMIEVSI